MKDSRQPWLHELAVILDGSASALSQQGGDVVGEGAQGLVVDDVRVLSRLEIRLGDGDLSPVGSAVAGPRAEFLSSARHLGDAGADPTVLVLRTREVGGGGLDEVVRVRSRSSQRVATTLRLVVGGDGAQLHDIKDGRACGPLQATTTDAGAAVSWSVPGHQVTLRLDPPAARWESAPDGAWVGFWPVDLPPCGELSVRLRLDAERRHASSFDADPGSDAVDWDTSVVVMADDPRIERLVGTGLVDLRHLLLRDPRSPGDVFAAAGSPWYLTLFGRDALWTARLALPLGTALALGTLRALARRQGTVHDADRAEEPGKIPHEIRRQDFVDESHGLRLPPVYYGTVDATALWVCTLHDAWRWGLADASVRTLLPALRSALTWLVEVAPSDDGLLRYVDETGHGLDNQGWKDSGDSIRWRDGRVADAPIALLEAQAYAVEAARGAARLLTALGEPVDSTWPARLDDYAHALTGRIRERYWVAGDGRPFLAMAIDGHGRPVDGVGSNMGHALGTGVLTADEADRIVDRITDPTMLLRHGIATLATDNGGFNPLGYHTGSVWTHDTAICALGLAREGATTWSAEVATRLLDAGEHFGYRMPELFADDGVLGRPVSYPASCRPQAWAAASAVALVTIALGLAVDAPARRVRLRPPHPAPFGALRVDGLWVGGHRVSVTADAEGAVSILGLPADWDVVVD